MLAPGLWISPHPDREAEATEVLREAAVADDAHVFVAPRSGLADVRVMVGAAWDLAEIEGGYQQFIEEFAAAAGGRAGPAGRVVHAWRGSPRSTGAARELLRPGGAA